jgi:hypothetical protein
MFVDCKLSHLALVPETYLIENTSEDKVLGFLPVYCKLQSEQQFLTFQREQSRLKQTEEALTRRVFAFPCFAVAL